MAMVVTKTADNTYEVELGEPEQSWVKLLVKKLPQSDVTVISMALANGLIELLTKFVIDEIDRESEDENVG